MDEQIDPVTDPQGALQRFSDSTIGKPPPPTPANFMQTAFDALGERDAYRKQQQEAYADQMRRLEEMSREPESEAGKWGALAEGALAVPAMTGNFGAMLASMGSKYGQFQQRAQAQRLASEQSIAKMRGDELRALESKDQMSAYLRAINPRGSGKPFEFRRNSDGTTTAFSNATGMPAGTYGPQDIGKLASLTEALAKAALEKGQYATLDEAMAWAQGQAMSQIRGMHAEVGNRTAPLKGEVGGLPTTPAPKVSFDEQPPDLVSPTQDGVGFSFNTSNMDDVDKAQVVALISAFKRNPTPQTKARVEAVLARMSEAAPAEQAPTSAPPPSAPTGGMPKKDVQTDEFKKAYGEGEGKAYVRKYDDIMMTGQAANTLEGKLNLMEQLTTQHGDNIPEGKAGPLIADIKSSMKSFGVDLKGSGVADVISSLGVEGALKSKTADGQNLLPGAMSNYEDQLLQRIFPSLGFTKEGRLLQIQIAKAQLEMRKNLAAAAREYRKNKGVLDHGWEDVAEAYAKANPFLDERRINALQAYAGRLAGGKK